MAPRCQVQRATAESAAATGPPHSRAALAPSLHPWPSLPLTLLLLALLTSLPGHPRPLPVHGANPTYARYIPRISSPEVSDWDSADISDLRGAPLAADGSLRHPLLGARFWRSEHLQGGLVSPALDQLRPVLGKLQGGQPLTVVAFGSSVTSDYGGLFHPSLERVRSMVRNLPVVYHTTRAFVPLAAGQAPLRGWLALFMSRLNATWPHANHTLVNAGMGGTQLSWVLGNCPEDMTPPNVDLFVLENVHCETEPAALERLIWWILKRAAERGDPRPAIVLINTINSYNNKFGPVSLATWAYCMKAAPYPCAAPACSAPDQLVALTLVGGHAVYPEQYRLDTLSVQVARHYGVAAFSMLQLLTDMVRDGVLDLPAHNGSHCRMLSSLYLDWIHPGPMGRLLLADALWGWLRAAERHAAELPAAGLPGVPRLPVHQNGREVSATRCFLTDAAIIEGGGVDTSSAVGAGADQGGAAAATAAAAAAAAAAAPGAAAAGGEAQAPVVVLENRGWRYVQFHRSERAADAGAVRYRPGYVAVAPGDTLLLRLDTELRRGDVEQGSERLMVSYLTSYEGMGKLRAACEGGCVCEPQVIDCHRAERVTVPAQAEWPATPSAACLLRLTLLNETSSGSFRVKLLNIVAKGQMAWSLAQVAFPPWTGFGGAAAAQLPPSVR